MNLSDLLTPWITSHYPNIEISGVHNDSRQIQPGFAFLAYSGAVTDGRCYIDQALEKGAAAIIYDPHNWPANCALPAPSFIPFPGLATKLAALTSKFYRHPAKKLNITGITGTNGKTTIAYQLAQAHELLTTSSAYIGTLGYGTVPSLEPLANTTPDALCLQTLFHNFVQKDIQQVSMEVSSHALAQGRVEEIEFQQAIFTNLTLDHLDFHHTMEAYAAAKATLFKTPTLKWAIVNQDDSYASLISADIVNSCQRVTYGIKEGSEVRVLEWAVDLQGTHITVESPWGTHQLTLNALGFFNIYNALAVFTSLLAYGHDVNKVVKVMGKLKAAPGRMEIVSQRPYVIVDYAHTPDALENVLQTLNDVKKGRVLVVFGCGGDRDKTKRPIMGNIAARYADVAIITSDNPRNEAPQQIMSEIKEGIDKTQNVHTIEDRKEAIHYAISLADEDDIVLVAGKGHEAYQQIGNKRYDFSDQAVIRELA